MADQPSVEELAAELDSLHQWHRLSPMAFMYFFASVITGLAQSLIYLIPAVAFGQNTISRYVGDWQYGLAIFIALVGVKALLDYLFYRYKLSDDHIEIRHGAFKRHVINLPFERIQNIKLERPLYYRGSGHLVMILDTAGSAKDEAKIIAVTQAYADQFKALVYQYKKDVNTQQNTLSTASEDTPAETDEVVINRRSVGDLVLHGVTNNRMWILLGALVPMFDTIFGQVNNYLMGHGIDLSQWFSDQTVAWWQVGLAVISLAALVLMLMAAFSVVGAIIMFYGFTLSKRGTIYIRRCGLFTQREVAVNLSRMQMIKGSQDWLDILLHRVNLVLAQNNNGLNEQQQLMSFSKLMVPSVKEQEAAAIVNDLWPTNAMYQTEFSAIESTFFWHKITMIVGPLFTLLLVLFITFGIFDGAAVSLFGGVAITGLLWLRWKRWGYHVDDQYVYVRSGLIGLDRTSFPRYKVQQVALIQTPRMKRKGVASCVFVLASGKVTIPHIPVSKANLLLNDLLYEIESGRRPWM